MIDLKFICNQILKTDIRDVSNENNFFESIYKYQIALLGKIYEAQVKIKEMEETNKSNPKLSYKFITYTKPLTLKVSTLVVDVDKLPEEDNQFVNRDYIDNVVANFYQKKDNVSSHISQEVVITSLTDSPLLNDIYFQENYLNTINPKIIDCALINQEIESLDSNNLIGYLDCKDYIVSIDDVIDLSKKVLRNENESFILTHSSIKLEFATINNTTIKGLYLTKSSYYLNRKDTFAMYVAQDNPYLSDKALINDVLKENTNMVKVIDLIGDLNKTKASKQWQTPGVIKTDSMQTDIINKIKSALDTGDSVDSNELISKEELEEILNYVVQKLESITGACYE